MNKKKLVGIIAVFAVIVIGVVIGITMTATSTTSGTSTEADASGTAGSASGDKAAAEELIDETVSQDDIEESVGKWADFEMNNEGCERGVYAGIFYYDNFTIFSRTYDKGQTYHIVSVN